MELEELNLAAKKPRRKHAPTGQIQAERLK
jgi:hypothetical protein